MNTPEPNSELDKIEKELEAIFADIQRSEESRNSETKPRVAGPNILDIPGALKGIPNWVGWNYEWVPDRWTKVPYDIKTRRKANTTNPHSWAAFEQAIEARSTYDGIGIVLNDSELVGIDLDHCIQQNGDIEPWAKEIVDSIPSYWEISPSGRGLRCFVRGTLPEDGRRTGPIEVYRDLGGHLKPAMCGHFKSGHRKLA